MLNELCLAFTVLWQRPSKNHNRSCEAPIPLTTNHVYFCYNFLVIIQSPLQDCGLISYPLAVYYFPFILCIIKISMQRSQARSRQVIHHGECLGASDLVNNMLTLFHTKVLKKTFGASKDTDIWDLVWRARLQARFLARQYISFMVKYFNTGIKYTYLQHMDVLNMNSFILNICATPWQPHAAVTQQKPSNWGWQMIRRDKHFQHTDDFCLKKIIHCLFLQNKRRFYLFLLVLF